MLKICVYVQERHPGDSDHLWQVGAVKQNHNKASLSSCSVCGLFVADEKRTDGAFD